MEKKITSLVLMSCLVMGILVEQTQAQPGWLMPVGTAAICYAACFPPCAAAGGSMVGVGSCAIQCLQNCIPKKSAAGGVGLSDTQYFCTLGCSTALCTNLSTKENPAAKKVGSCMESCSALCAKKN